jgi:hypothetical protein
VRSNVCQLGSWDVNLSFQSSRSGSTRVLVAYHDVSLVKQFLCGHRNGFQLVDGVTGDTYSHEQRWKVATWKVER